MLARKSPRVMTTPGVRGMSEAAVVVEKVGDFALFGLEVVACVVRVATDAEDSFRTRMNPAGNIVVNGEWKERRTGDAGAGFLAGIAIFILPLGMSEFRLLLLQHFSFPPSKT